MKELDQPIAERLLLREHALETELLLHPGADDRSHQRVRDLGRATAVAHHERRQDNPIQLRRGRGASQAERAKQGVDRNPEGIRQTSHGGAVAVLVPGPPA